MRAAAILGLGCSPKNLKPFQSDNSIEWLIGLPAASEEADVILIFGGDGTIHRHLAQLVRLSLPVLVVPVGSGNDFARALGLRRVRDSIAAWQKYCGERANIRTIDLGFITPLDAPARSGPPARYFCSVAGIGLDGAVARRANQLPRWMRGHGGYALSLAPAIFTFAPVATKILTTDDATVQNEMHTDENKAWATRSDQPTTLVAFANTPFYGGGIKIAPRAQMNDGLLDICIVGAINRLNLLRLVPSVYAGRHLALPEVDYFSSDLVRVETERPLAVYADGEYVCDTPVEIAVRPAALRVLTL